MPRSIDIKPLGIKDLSKDYGLILGTPFQKRHQPTVNSTGKLSTEAGWSLNLSESYLAEKEIVDIFAVSLTFTEVVTQESNPETKKIIGDNEDVFTMKNSSKGLLRKLGNNGVHRIIMKENDQRAVKQNPYRMSPFE